MKKFFRSLSVFTAAVSAALFVLCAVTAYLTPSELRVEAYNSDLINGSFPLSVKYDEAQSAAAEPGGYSASKASIMLFDAVPVKEVDITVSDRMYVDVSGKPFGIRIYTDGLVVSSVTPVTTGSGEKCPAADAGISQGDVILTADGKALTTNEQLLAAVRESGGSPLAITARGSTGGYTASVRPVFDSSAGEYKIGLMVKDSCAGIGTMTFVDSRSGVFAGLGHGICDSMSGSIMPLENGDIVSAEITSVRKSVCGSPGSLCGSFTSSSPLGAIRLNSDKGVYGCMDFSQLPAYSTLQKIPVAYKQEVVRGRAQILAAIEGTAPELFDVEIEDISYNNANTAKNMIIRITDKRLLELTGGIVQGMSGSPIIQNGMLAGAVTHVFVNDPTRGYAVFSENMIKESESF